MFDVDPQDSFAKREEKILDFWQREKIFEKSLEAGVGKPIFTFYDGPPFATGLPHYGHLLAGTIKDTVLRYKTMQGFYVPRVFGWDCHGLPVENEIEKAQNLSGGKSIHDFGIAKFNEECRAIVLKYVGEWKATVERMGRWVDFDGGYKTMDLNFMESVWWAFGELYKKGLVYEGLKVMPFSAKLGTPLSNFEANLNYKDVDDPSITVMMREVGEAEIYFLVWTTTPWSLPSNQLIAVKPDLEYVQVLQKSSAKRFILAKCRVAAVFKDEVVQEKSFLGHELAGRKYEPVFPYFKDGQEAGWFRVAADDFVNTEDGTGIVSISPAFGEDDFYLCAKLGVEPVCPVDSDGKFIKPVLDYEGLFVKDADKEIIRRLKTQGNLFHHTQIRHRYPFCWRTDTPLIYRAMKTWFVAVEKIKEDILGAAGQIYWVPGHIKSGRFGKWLENARDWAISRNRYWGTPIPIWRADDGECLVVGSIAELEQKVGVKITDLHRHKIDHFQIKENGKVFKRTPEVFDCWFEAGSMPYAQRHYPFENENGFRENFPADFIAEGLDQTRGWFYTLTVLSAALFKKPAFKNGIVNGLILAEDGAKMSKRLRNYPDPELVINQYGADAIRLYMLSSPAVRGDDLRFSERGVEQLMRQVAIPLWNSYVFLCTYAKIYDWSPKTSGGESKQIDKWLISLTDHLVEKVSTAMDAYELDKALHPLTEFIDQLTNWYIRRCRARFWAAEDTPDRKAAFMTLYNALMTLCKLLAPFMPFLAEEIYRGLRQLQDPISVHLTDFPKTCREARDVALEESMGLVQVAVGLGHALRKEHKLKVRQPLKTAYVISADAEKLAILQREKELIQDELNVKNVVLRADETEFVEISIKPNFRTVGKKVGKGMNLVQNALKSWTMKEFTLLQQQGHYCLDLEGVTVDLLLDDVELQRSVKAGLAAESKGDITVALDTALDEALIEEALAREIVNKVNTMRREQGFHVQDRITITIDASDVVEACFGKHGDYIKGEVLAVDVQFSVTDMGTTWDLNGENATIQIEKIFS